MSDPKDRVAETLRRHWLGMVVGALLAYATLPFVAPIVARAGAPGLANLIYTPYKAVCHTYAFRSFFLFGPQPVYPRGDGDGPFERASGIDPTTPAGLFAARDFIGNEQMGYKVALCERDQAIYYSLALNGIAFAALRRRGRQLPWAAFILFGIGPIGLDGFSQLLSQPPLSLIPFRESTWWLRMLTGSLFGTSVAWLVFPLIQAAFEDDVARP